MGNSRTRREPDPPPKVTPSLPSPVEVEFWRRCRSVEVDTGALTVDELDYAAEWARNVSTNPDLTPALRAFAAELARQLDDVRKWRQQMLDQAEHEAAAPDRPDWLDELGDE